MAAVKSRSPLRSLGLWVETQQCRMASVYDRIASHDNRERLERLMVYIATLGFLVHLLLIFLVNTLPVLQPLDFIIGTNYLAAISTPFSVILFYEVLLLVLALPESTTRSLATQFEVISLIVLRNVFKELAKLESLEEIEQQFEVFSPILIDMGGGLLLFLMVTVFYHVSHRRTHAEQELRTTTLALEHFIVRKKVVALLLVGLLVGLAGNNLLIWTDVGYQAFLGTPATDLVRPGEYYTELFTVLIFTDVLILILSLLLSDSYHLVVRNAGFVIATILLRVSLSMTKPFDVVLAMVAVLFAILVLLIYKYHSRLMPEENEYLVDHDLVDRNLVDRNPGGGADAAHRE